MSKFDIRVATTQADREGAYRLRYELYVEQQGLFGDVADHQNRWLRDHEDDTAYICVAEHEGEIVGTYRIYWCGEEGFSRVLREAYGVDAFRDIVREQDIGLASRMLVAPEYRGSPLPFKMMLKGWAEAVERGTEVLLAECEPHLVNKWYGLGFRPFGLGEHPINGTLVRLAFVLGDLEHVRELDSPLTPILAKWSRSREPAARINELLRRSQEVVSAVEGRTRFWEAVEQNLPRNELAHRLGELSGEELEALLDKGHALDCEPEALIIRKGHVSRTLFVLLTGALAIRDEGEIVAVVREPGEVVGEVAFFSGADRMSDVLAGPDGARVLALSERSLRSLIETQGTGTAKFLLSLTRSLSHKLRQRARRPSDAITQIAP